MNTQNICNACPRGCSVDRTNTRGFCKSFNKVKIVRASRHMWEEPCISGTNGSGTVFFSGCNLQCVYCQNSEINSGKRGKVFDKEELKELFLGINEGGVHNINLVTPTHFLPLILEAVSDIKKSLKIPIICNCSGYEKPEYIKECQGLIDIFLTDFKYKSNELALRYSNCHNYFETAMSALEKMIDVCGRPKLENEIMKSGVIVRHLILPSHKNDSIDILNELYKNFGNEKFLVSLMSQFIPNDKCKNFPEINRKITSLEYKRVLDCFMSLDFKGFVQELSSAKKEYVPDFDEEGEFLIK